MYSAFVATAPTPLAHSCTVRFRTALMGVGGCGGNAVDQLVFSGVQGVDFIYADSDFKALRGSLARRQIQLGTDMAGTGDCVRRERLADAQTQQEISRAVSGSRVLFIAAGLGGGVGSAAVRSIAKVAQRLGIVTIGFVTLPFEFEGTRRNDRATKALDELGHHLDITMVVPNQRMLEVLGDSVTQEDAFAMANDVLKSAINAFNDFCTLMQDAVIPARVHEAIRMQGRSIFRQATATGPHRTQEALERALDCPLLQDQSVSKAKNVLVKLTCASGSLQLGELLHVRSLLLGRTSPNANVNFYAACDESLGGSVRISMIATGM